MRLPAPIFVPSLISCSVHMVPISQPYTTPVTFYKFHLRMPLRYEFEDGVSNTASYEEHLQTIHKCAVPIGCGYWESVCREHFHTTAQMCNAPQTVDTRKSLCREHLPTTQVCSSHRLWILGSPCVVNNCRLHSKCAMLHRLWVLENPL